MMPPIRLGGKKGRRNPLKTIDRGYPPARLSQRSKNPSIKPGREANLSVKESNGRFSVDQSLRVVRTMSLHARQTRRRTRGAVFRRSFKMISSRGGRHSIKISPMMSIGNVKTGYVAVARSSRSVASRFRWSSTRTSFCSSICASSSLIRLRRSVVPIWLNWYQSPGGQACPNNAPPDARFG